MTLSAYQPDKRAPNVKVTITYGPVVASVEEHVSHVRAFHSQLGSLLDEIEKEA